MVQSQIQEKRIVFNRLWLAFALVVVLLVLLCYRYFHLQVVQHEGFATKSERNRVELIPIPPRRGLIYDRHGRLLAENRPSHQLVLVPELVQDLPQLLQDLQQLIQLDDNQIQVFYQRLSRARRPHSPVVLRDGLDDSEMAALALERHNLRGVDTQATLVRYYPYGELFAHSVGYVGRINEEEMRVLDRGRYAGMDVIGKVGVERTYEDVLHGTPGFRKVETNVHGRIIRELERKPPIPGQDLILHLDVDVQRAAFDAMKTRERRGAVVAIEVETGGIVAMLSAPSYDPNLFVSGIPASVFNPLRDSIDVPFLDRAARGIYPPGSTVKPFVGLAGLEQGVVNWQTTIRDPGFYRLPNEDRVFYNWTWATRRGGAGDRVDMVQAIAESNNTYFWDLAYNMTLEPMHEMYDKFGFGRNLALDVFRPAAGLNPSRQWKRQHRQLPWFAGDTLNTAVGQGFMLATPLQIASATNILANEGVVVHPRLLKNTHSGELPLIIPEPEVIQLSNSDDWQQMFAAMRQTVHGARGTARPHIQSPEYDIAAKTGTAQAVSRPDGSERMDPKTLEERQRSHALFNAFAPARDPKISIAVVVDNGESGGRAGGPIAKEVLDAFLLGPPEARLGPHLNNQERFRP